MARNAPVIAAQKELREAVGKPKREFTPRVVEAGVQAEAESIIGGRITDALLIQAKLEREAACNALKDEMEEKLVEKFGEEDITGFIVGEAFYSIQKAAVRKLVLDEGKRLDGRGFEDLKIVWRSPPIPYSAHSLRKDLPDELKRRVRAGLMDLRRDAPDAYLAIEPDLPGGFEPVVHGDYRPVLRTFEDDYATLLNPPGR